MDRAGISDKIDLAALNGYALSQSQIILNQTGISAPIKGPDGRAYAALQISVSSQIWGEERIQNELLPYILEAAQGISPQVRDR